MELYAENGIVPVLYRHHLAVGGKRRDLQAIGHRPGVYGKGMVSCHGCALWTAHEQRTFGNEFHIGLLSVHQLLGVGDRSAERCTDCLMSQANAENRNVPAQYFGDLHNNS